MRKKSGKNGLMADLKCDAMVNGFQTVLSVGGGRTVDLRRADLAEIQGAIAAMPSWHSYSLADRLKSAVAAATYAGESQRIAIAKLLLALLPITLETLLNLLRERRPPELLFSLFCTVDQTLDLQLDDDILNQIAAAVGAYLLEVESETARAPWMAGDLLGDHWPMDVALPILLGAAENARYKAGRAGAVHGLSHALERADKRRQWEIAAMLERVASRDRSQHVRAYAEDVLNGLRGF
jgi:hypothetical protein